MTIVSCFRLFSTKGKKLSELDPNLFAKSKGGALKGEKSAKELEKQKEVASIEAQVRQYFISSKWLKKDKNGIAELLKFYFALLDLPSQWDSVGAKSSYQGECWA